MTIAKTLTANLVKIAQAYGSARQMSLAAVGRKFYGNATFFDKLKAGKRSISIHKYGEMIDAIRADWPEDARWPTTQVVVIGRQR